MSCTINLQRMQNDFETSIVLAVIKIIGSLFCSLTKHPLNVHLLHGETRHRQVRWLIQGQGSHLMVSHTLNPDLLFFFFFQCFLTLAQLTRLLAKNSLPPVSTLGQGLHLIDSRWSGACVQLLTLPVTDALQSVISSDCFLRSQKVESSCL